MVKIISMLAGRARTEEVVPFALAYPAPWRVQGAEVVDRDGVHVEDFASDTPEDLEFWRGIVEAVNARAAWVEPVDPALADQLAECLAAIVDTPLIVGKDSMLSAPVELRLGFFKPEIADRAATLLEEAGR